MSQEEVWISLEDVMQALSFCNDPGEKKKLSSLYTNEDYNDLGRKLISKESEIYKIIKKYQVKERITIDDLSLALTRSTYECNYSIQKKLKKYIHQYFDHIKQNVDTDLVFYQIKEDKIVMAYIERFDSFIQYENSLEQESPNQEIKEPEKRKSYVIMNGD